MAEIIRFPYKGKRAPSFEKKAPGSNSHIQLLELSKRFSYHQLTAEEQKRLSEQKLSYAKRSDHELCAELEIHLGLYEQLGGKALFKDITCIVELLSERQLELSDLHGTTAGVNENIDNHTSQL